MRCFHNTFTDIYFHLAAEEYLLKQETDSVFMLWQDTPSVVMGKHQSVQLEVNREWAEEQQIQIARRFSGNTYLIIIIIMRELDLTQQIKSK